VGQQEQLGWEGRVEDPCTPGIQRLPQTAPLLIYLLCQSLQSLPHRLGIGNPECHPGQAQDARLFPSAIDCNLEPHHIVLFPLCVQQLVCSNAVLSAMTKVPSSLAAAAFQPCSLQLSISANAQHTGHLKSAESGLRCLVHLKKELAMLIEGTSLTRSGGD